MAMASVRSRARRRRRSAVVAAVGCEASMAAFSYSSTEELGVHLRFTVDELRDLVALGPCRVVRGGRRERKVTKKINRQVEPTNW